MRYSMDKYKYFYFQSSTKYGVNLSLNNNNYNIHLFFHGSKTQDIHKKLNRPTIHTIQIKSV